MPPKKALGKGLGALISTESREGISGVTEVDINKIEPNKKQPRKYFDEESLGELAESIKAYGVVQPLIVRDEGEYYSIVAGERRWRAARMAKLAKLPVIIKNYSDSEVLQIALIENIQRKDLNPIEEADCYRRLIDEFFLTQEDIAEKVGRSRSSVANSLRLLTLDKRVQAFVLESKLSEGQARALLAVTDGDLQFEFADRIIDEGLSVREAVQFIKTALEAAEAGEEVKPVPVKSPVHYKTLERDLKSILGTRVNIKEKDNKGKIEIEYYSHDELDRLLVMLNSITERQTERN